MAEKAPLTPEQIEAEKQKKRENLEKAREAKKALEAKATGESDKPVEEVKETKKKVKDKVMDFEIDPSVTYEFTRLDGNVNARHIPSKTIVWDEVSQDLKEIRLSKLEKSPYVEDQSEMAVQEPSIILKGSSLFISGQEEYKIRYLLAHDSNAEKSQINPANRGAKALYKIRDIKTEQDAQVKREETILEAKILIKGATDEELDLFLRSHLGKKVESQYLKTKAYELASVIPANFISKFNDPINVLKVAYQEAIEKGELVEKDGEVILAISNEVIYRYDPKKVSRVDTDIAKFMLTESEEATTLKSILGL